MNYDEAVAWLASLSPRGWRLGLDRMAAFVRAAGLEPTLSSRAYLHVAGTNGKGSVTAFLQSALVAQGYATGGYFSPYVVHPRERIQIGGEMVSEMEFATLATAIRRVADEFDGGEWGGVTEFEAKTAMGLLAWERARCDVVALEVGLGGRLDATNVVSPRACAIVSIGYDHVGILGESLREIATEKAGILKSGVPVVVGEVPSEAAEAIARAADRAGAPLRWIRRGEDYDLVGKEFSGSFAGEPMRFELAMPGPIQAHNAAVALATLEAGGFLRDLSAMARAGSSWVRALPGRLARLEIGGRDIHLDGAHNAEAAAALVASYPRGTRFDRAIVGMLRGHDPVGFFRSLAPLAERISAVPVENPRALPPAEIVAAAREAGLVAHAEPDLTSALALPAERRLVTGSFYLVGEAMRLASTPDPRSASASPTAGA